MYHPPQSDPGDSFGKDKKTMNIANFADALLYRILGPFIVGYFLFVIIHWTMGLVANVEADGDEIRLSKWKYYYLVSVYRMKDALWPWALGVIIFMLIGLI
jgi:hypothetical protein